MKIVIALGGNALGNTPREQKKILKEVSLPLAELVEKGHEIVFVHGNGPQVGMINKAFNGDMPLSESTAMSQGYIGYHLQNALQNALNKKNIEPNIASIVTQILVDKDDKGFTHPDKPIGEFFSKEPTDEYEYMEDSNRGYRRVVASPKPLEVIEIKNIESLIDNGYIIIAAGGGGIPVIKSQNGYEGVEAVIDKDYAAALIADRINADCLMILTAIDQVAINFGEKDEKFLSELTTEKAEEYLEKGHFGKGSMEPKVAASVKFVKKNDGRQAIITSLDNINKKEKTIIKNS